MDTPNDPQRDLDRIFAVLKEGGWCSGPGLPEPSVANVVATIREFFRFREATWNEDAAREDEDMVREVQERARRKSSFTAYTLDSSGIVRAALEGRQQVQVYLWPRPIPRPDGQQLLKLTITVEEAK